MLFFRTFAAMKSVTDIFAALGDRLSRFGADDVSRRAIENATAANNWFTETDIRCAVDAICRQMLRREKIERWLADYSLAAHEPKRVAIIMAGNIPLVGFFDLMCVIVSGNIPCVKYSSKDTVLMEYVVSLLREIESELPVEYFEKGKTVDAVIATGGDSANLYFGAEFADIPHLLRGSRHSVAVLSGDETEADLCALADDVFMYAGLGCRNVSLVFVPRDYNLQLPPRKMCRGYHNNYLQCRAMLAMRGVGFDDNGEAVFVRDAAGFPTSLSRINIAEYDSPDDVAKWLSENDDRLQCVVSSSAIHHRTVPFGQAQYPSLTDYPDDADVMEFLISL
jgi:acyl-coA reductase (luxC)